MRIGPARALIFALVTLLALLLWLARNPEAIVTFMPGVAIEPTAGPTPSPPTITAPRGPLPTGHAGLEAWARYRDGEWTRAGSGFLLQIPNGAIVGVMTAHSLMWGDALDRIAFRLPQQTPTIIEFDPRAGSAGRAFTGYHFDLDFVVLPTDEPVDTALVLQPDARGGPQPGERVVLFSGSGDGAGNPRALYGTVTAASAEAVWAQMDDVFDPANLSGSPLLSAHTGQVVGMAVAGRERSPMLLGFHPIASLVNRASLTNTPGKSHRSAPITFHALRTLRSAVQSTACLPSAAPRVPPPSRSSHPRAIKSCACSVTCARIGAR